jgi:hypothetical protein
MKKLFLIATMAFPFTFNAQLMSENFDAYSDGDLLSVVGSSNGWEEWDGGTGTAQSNTVSTLFSFSDLNSGKAEGGNNGLWTWTDITEGTIKFSMQLYIPEGSNGAYIGLGDEEMTDQPNSINILGDSLLFALDWEAQALIGSAVEIESDSWIAIDFILDIDNQTAEFIVDGTSIGSGGTSFGTSLGFGGINFWGVALNPFTGTQLPAEYYFDDLRVVDLLASIQDEKAIAIDILPNPSNGQFTVNFNNYNFEKAKMIITDMTGAIVHSESLQSVSNSTKSFDLNLNNGLYLVKISDNLNQFTTRIVID